MNKHALIIGASGVIGSSLATHLLAQGWQVTGVSRGRTPVPAGCVSLQLDATDGAAVSAALTGLDASHVFFTAWARQANEQENIRVNGAMVANVLAALGPNGHLRHAALVTGLKHYLGPFDAYGKGNVPVTPFREEQGRQAVENFYYAQEDRLFEAAAQYGFTWSVHRPHTIIGYALGNAMNMGLTLAVYASLCKACGQPFVFPGSPAQWHGLSDMTDAGQIARHLAWAVDSPAARNEDFNIVNGDVFRWKWLWPRLAAYFGVEAADLPETMAPLADRMQDAPAQWRALAQQHGLVEADIGRLASWWHTDADLGRPMEVMTDMGKSRKAGFLDYQDTQDAFIALFERLKAERVIPR
ncbi:SDR family oxidoreductase [Janthinobacterium sp. LB2P49]|uniref:SDR family oxidoreductase n=1 Tax=Janthinobacterium sp. LB2P49 TaxID=3424198 RepID=UPI003F1E8BD1